MGNYISYRSHVEVATGKVVFSDGAIFEFNEPMTAAELMLEHPNQVVVEYQPISAPGRRLRPMLPLPADEKLQARKVYVMLHVKRGGCNKFMGLSSEEARRAILMVDSVLRPRQCGPASKFLPLIAKTCMVGVGEGTIVEPVVRLVDLGRDVKEEDEAIDVGLESYGGEEKPFGYLSRELSGRGWKPSLDTIEEKMLEIRKLPHWLF